MAHQAILEIKEIKVSERVSEGGREGGWQEGSELVSE
jgi:hypothetical protein